MNLRQIEIVHAVMTAGSVNAAARTLRISQPAVSKALRQIEHEVGMDLFRREKGRLHPTVEAHKLFPEIEKVLGDLEAVRNYAADLRDSRSGVLTLATTPTLSAAFIPQAIARFRANRPGIRVWLNVTEKRQVIDHIRSGRVDLGLVTSPTDEWGLDFEKLLEAEFIVLMPKDHALARLDVIEKAELSRYPIISSLRKASSLHAGSDIPPRPETGPVAITANHTFTACTLAEAGAGLALVDPLIRKDLFPSLLRKPYRPRIDISPHLALRKGHPMPRMIAEFIRTVREAVAASATLFGVGVHISPAGPAKPNGQNASMTARLPGRIQHPQDRRKRRA